MRRYHEVLISGVVTALLLYFLSPAQVGTSFIVLGHAHFLLAYYYQFKAGRVNRIYILRFSVVALFLLLLAWATHYSTAAILCVAAFVFAVHFMLDELYLLGFEPRPIHTLLLVSLVFPYTALAIDVGFSLGWSVGAAMLSFCASICYVFYRRTVWDCYLASFGFFLSYVVAISAPIASEKLLASIILFHYTRWYLSYYSTMAGDKRLTFIRNTFIVNILLATLCFISSERNAASVMLGTYFSYYGFYACTILHVISSLRRRSSRRGAAGYRSGCL